MEDDKMLVEEYVSPLCDNPCVPEDENKKPCPKRDYGIACNTDWNYSNFYNIIDWNKLFFFRREIMCGFADYLTLMLIENQDFGNLFQKVYNQVPVYGRDDFVKLEAHVENFPTMSPSRISNPNDALDYFDPKSITSDQGYCDDINFSFAINCNDNTPSKYKLRIFHIALHSARPKKYDMVIDGIATRSEKEKKYTCGWYQNTNPPDEFDNGPFHYKIDNVIAGRGDSRAACDSNLPEDKCPFKKIIYDSYGSFYLMEQQEMFENLDNDRTCTETLAANPASKSKNKKFTVPREFLYNQVNSLHKEICNLFIIFWNTKVLPNVYTHFLAQQPSTIEYSEDEYGNPSELQKAVDMRLQSEDIEMDTDQRVVRNLLPDFNNVEGGNKNKLKRRKTKRRKTKRRKTKQRKTKRRKTKK